MACASAVSHRTGSNHYAHARLHTEPASEVPEVSVSEEPAHDSLSGKFCSRHRSGKPLHRLEVIGQHVIAQGQPQADLQPVGLSLAPQRQLHDSALCHPQEQIASSPAHLADGEGRAQGSGVAAAVAAAEGAVVALMAPNGSWASGRARLHCHSGPPAERQTANFRPAGPACEQHGLLCGEQPRGWLSVKSASCEELTDLRGTS